VTASAAETVDAFLDGRVRAVQLERHHRSGLEAILLSAAVPATFAGTVVDLGAGTGVAGMAIAARAPAARVMLVERDPVALDAARRSLALGDNAAFAARVSVAAADVTAPEAERVAAGLRRAFADWVVTNPPFRDAAAGSASPSAPRRDAHVAGEEGVQPWVRTAASVLKPGGMLAVVFRADGLAGVLAAMAGRFGAISVLPVHPRAGRPALRIVVVGEKGSRGPERLLPGMVLHRPAGNGYLEPVERILRHGASLADVLPGWPVAAR
jgi:tRNA1(Val) A37 N6-methylase TrmN6